MPQAQADFAVPLTLDVLARGEGLWVREASPAQSIDVYRAPACGRLWKRAEACVKASPCWGYGYAPEVLAYEKSLYVKLIEDKVSPA